MDNNIDNKKVIQMVAIIGILCIFVGVATRIRQNNQKTLGNYSKSETQATVDTSVSTISNGVDTDTHDANTSTSTASPDTTSSNTGDSTLDTNSNDAQLLSEITEYEYDHFYYTDTIDDNSKIHLLYYNDECEVEDGILECKSEDAYDLLLIFYKLYKTEYQFSSIKSLSEYESIDAAREANNTFTNDGVLYINPLYNPIVSYENGIATSIPDASASYIDRTNNFPYKISTDDYAYTLLTEQGYYWGGNRNTDKDYASFKK